MALTDRKITTYTNPVANLPDNPSMAGMTAAQLKAAFDAIANEDLKTTINGIIDDLTSITDSASGADNIGVTAIPDLNGLTIQSILESLRNILKSITDGVSGADFIGTTTIDGLAGNTVQAVLESLKSYIDIYNTNHKKDTSTDHDNRYYTEAEIDSKVANLQTQVTNDANSLYAHKNTDAVVHPGSKVSLNPADKTKITATEVQTAINQIENEIKQFVGADANAEVADARISTVKSKTFPSVRDRLEESEEQINSLDALKANQTDLETTNSNLNLKRDISVQIKNSDLDISLDANKIKLINLADEVQQALTGNASALSVIPNKSITMEKLGFSKVLSKNMFNKAAVTTGKKINRTTGVLEDNLNYCTSEYIEVDINAQYVINYSYNGAYFDADFNYVSGFQPTSEGSAYAFTTPSNVKYLRFSVYLTVLNTTQMEKGDSVTFYESYLAKIDSDAIENVTEMNNIIDEITTYDSLAINTGTFTAHREPSSTFKGWAIPFLKSDFEENITYMSWFISVGANTNVPITFELLNNLGEFVRTITNTTITSSGNVKIKCKIVLDELTDIFFLAVRTTQSDVVLMLGNAVQDSDYDFPVMVKYSTNVSTPIYVNSTSNSNGVTDIKLGTGMVAIPKKINKVILNLPDKYELVIGDTFELFYKGIILANNPYNYNINLLCEKGQAFSKRYIYTPLESDIGTHVLIVSIYDDNEILLDTKNVNLIVNAKASNPSTVKTILNIGDSLTAYGIWVNELYNRLVTQDGLNNLNFVGTKVVTPGIGFEGYGGWTYNNYLTNINDGSRIWVITTHDKDVTDQHSIWKDINNTYWKLETIESGQIKLIRTIGTTILPSSGTLVWVSGGIHTADIVYTSTIAESSNPFWNENTNNVDFANYATELGITSIDYVNILLGWNSTSETEATYKNYIRTFVNKIIADFPNVKITLVGLQVPSLDGIGANYGTDWNYYDKLKFVFNLDKWHKDVASEYDNVDVINLSGQFDTENNMRTDTRTVNVRSTKTETYGTNGVHPADEGYYQIADAVYRSLNSKI